VAVPSTPALTNVGAASLFTNCVQLEFTKLGLDFCIITKVDRAEETIFTSGCAIQNQEHMYVAFQVPVALPFQQCASTCIFLSTRDDAFHPVRLPLAFLEAQQQG
jgi:hypothetical protein